ncbi:MULTISPECIES: methylated-DNA--[protein]-cysteine S-methyltransferase [unclassified Luteococcus]|uniref:methylated-DNA--[protein]-cysteine S-methyltransferase n=1 Tax=unclassified Luteococcus TaxID=2639923 RepID=UPI00313AD96B
MSTRHTTAPPTPRQLQIFHHTVDSPIGPLLLVATEAGLVRVAFAGEGFPTVLEGVTRTLDARPVEDPSRLGAAARQLEEYFAGTRRTFDLPLDRRLSTGFRRTVQDRLSSIGYGQTRTYAQLAEEVGNPRAVRAVGSACATNPLPVVVPCHRVLRSNGSLGGYLGGLGAKAALLALESAALA